MSFGIDVAARTVWMEARGEPLQGQKGVAYVLRNRVRAGGFGENLTEVCLRASQFSCWNTADPNRVAMARLPEDDANLSAMTQLVSLAMNDATGQFDPTNGATFYITKGLFNSNVAPAFFYHLQRTAEIGNHYFFKEAK